MTTVIINNRSYPCPSDWNEIDWEQFYLLKEYAASKKGGMQNTDRTDNGIYGSRNFGKTGKDKINKGKRCGNPRMEEVTARLLSRICSVDRNTARKTDPVERKLFAECLIERFLKQNFTETETTGKRRENAEYTENVQSMENAGSFEWNGKRLFLPVPATGFDGEAIPLPDTTAAELCEATDLYMCDRWRYAPVIAAVLCREKERRYRETDIRIRAQTMRRLPMNTILRLYGMLHEAHLYLKNNYPLCYENDLKRNGMAGKQKTTWNELLLWAGHFRIHEIEQVGRMNCHDFMRLVQSRIKMRA